MITVRELVEQLSAMDPDRVVIMQDDAEGNGYRLLRLADDNAAYIPSAGWSGSVKRQSLDEEDIAAGFGEEDIAPAEAVPCVVLVPVN